VLLHLLHLRRLLLQGLPEVALAKRQLINRFSLMDTVDGTAYIDRQLCAALLKHYTQKDPQPARIRELIQVGAEQAALPLSIMCISAKAKLPRWPFSQLLLTCNEWMPHLLLPPNPMMLATALCAGAQCPSGGPCT
jgi:hypothetical protein